MSEADAAQKYFRTSQGPRVDVLRKYGISVYEYEEILKLQGGICITCGSPPKGQLLSVDHDRRTGTVRGLLCTNCNSALGMVHDDVSILKALIRYLEH